MSIRKGYIYALLLALGLLLWTQVLDAWQAAPKAPAAETMAADQEGMGQVPWTSAEAVYECSMKAQELGLVLSQMHLASDVRQGSMDVLGPREALQDFYTWLETEGCFREILAFQMETEDDAASRLSISYQL